MQTKIILAMVIIATAALAIAPALANTVLANPPPPTRTTTCENHGGHTSTGSCSGNTPTNHKTETTTCTAKNSGLQKKLCP